MCLMILSSFLLLSSRLLFVSHVKCVLFSQGIVHEVLQSTQLMLNQLFQQLRSNSPLPVCLRVIGYLRRMDVFMEAELRVKFLQARTTWLDSILAAIPKDDPYFHITKTIEACRVHLFDIITQYRAIFSDEDPHLPPAGGHMMVDEGAIFHGWVVQRVADFLETLERDLQLGVGGRLDSLLGQCMYFGLSFSRVGADFRGQLAPMFQQVAAKTFSKSLQESVDKFQEDMNLYTLISLPSAMGGAITTMTPSVQPGTLQPPMSLLDFQPLACFLNNILVAFNDLRLCCPISLVQNITKSLEETLMTVSTCSPLEHQKILSHCTQNSTEKYSYNFQSKATIKVVCLCRSCSKPRPYERNSSNFHI